MPILRLLVSLICLLSFVIAAKITNRCELCFDRSHVFKDHLINGDSVEEIRNLIQEYFKRLKKGTHTKTYFKMVTTYLSDDVNFILEQPKFESSGKGMVIEVFRTFLSLYRDMWNRTLKHTKGHVPKMTAAIAQISSSDIQEAMTQVLSREFQQVFANTPSKKRRLQYPSQTDSKQKAPRQNTCLLCFDRTDHQFIEHIKSFNFDDLFKRLTKAYFERYKSSLYARHYKELLVKFLAVHVNQIMHEYAISHPKMKAALVEIFDQLISSYVEYRNSRAIGVESYLRKFEDAILGIEDAEIQTSACSIIIRRIVLIRDEKVQFPTESLLLGKLSSLNHTDLSLASIGVTKVDQQISKSANINYDDQHLSKFDAPNRHFDQSFIEYVPFTSYLNDNSILIEPDNPFNFLVSDN